MNKSNAKFWLAVLLIIGIIAISLASIFHGIPAGVAMGEDGVLGMALMGLMNYTSKERDSNEED